MEESTLEHAHGKVVGIVQGTYFFCCHFNSVAQAKHRPRPQMECPGPALLAGVSQSLVESGIVLPL